MSAAGAWRRRAARLGLFAVLFQAILFGWHHHDLVFATDRDCPVVHNSTSPAQPADDEDGCEICQVLHHQTAASGDFIATPLPGFTVSPSVAADPVGVIRSFALAFHARAPPSLDAA